MRKIIVTGGCGFIGSHLVDRLCELQFDVHVIDDLSASENDKFYYNKKATYYKVSICDKELIEPIFDDTDCVFHLAAESRIQPAIQNPNRAYMVNVVGTLNIVDISTKKGVNRIIYSSTSSVYGLTDVLPTREEEKIDCLNPYSHSKFLGEEILRFYSKVYNLDSVILRYFNVFGERSPIKGQYAPVVGIFLNQFSQNQPLTVVGDGLRKRDFVHVRDVVESNIKAMKKESKLNAQVFNIGTGSNLSILDLAKSISNKINFIPNRIGEADNTLAEISKAKKELNFLPEIDIKKWVEQILNDKN